MSTQPSFAAPVPPIDPSLLGGPGNPGSGGNSTPSLDTFAQQAQIDQLIALNKKQAEDNATQLAAIKLLMGFQGNTVVPGPFVDPVPAPPPFLDNHTSSGTSISSIFDFFPRIETSTLLAISRHEFKPTDLYQLDSRLRDKFDDRSSQIEGDIGSLLKLKAKSGSSKDYPSFQSLQRPLLVYFDVLTTFAASSGKAASTRAVAHGAFEYMAHLADLNAKYEWSAVYTYHMDFHLECRNEMKKGDYSGWAFSSTQLMNTHLFNRARSFNSTHPAPFTSSRKSNPSSSKSSSSQNTNTQYCFAFQFGNCTGSVCPNNRMHKCRKCDSMAHGDSACDKKD